MVLFIFCGVAAWSDSLHPLHQVGTGNLHGFRCYFARSLFFAGGRRSSTLACRRHLIQEQLVIIFPYVLRAMCFDNDTPMRIADNSTYGSYEEEHVQERAPTAFFLTPTQSVFNFRTRFYSGFSLQQTEMATRIYLIYTDVSTRS